MSDHIKDMTMLVLTHSPQAYLVKTDAHNTLNLSHLSSGHLPLSAVRSDHQTAPVSLGVIFTGRTCGRVAHPRLSEGLTRLKPPVGLLLHWPSTTPSPKPLFHKTALTAFGDNSKGWCQAGSTSDLAPTLVP